MVVSSRVFAPGCQQLLLPLGIEEQRSNEADLLIREEALQKPDDVLLLNPGVVV
jgi:hypothetical protein